MVYAPQLVNLSGDVETRRRESLHEEGAREGSATSQAIGTVHPGFPQVRQATAGDDGRRGGRESVEWGTPPPKLRLEEDAGGGTEKRWITPRHPIGSQSSGSRRSAWRYTALYPPPREMTPISVPPSPIYNYIPIEEEVEWAVRRLPGHRLGGLSQMCAEHLWELLREHRAEEAAKVKAKEAKVEAEAEAEAEKLGSLERERKSEEGTAGRV